MVIDNHLFLEDLLIERIKTKVPEFLEVIGAAQLSAMEDDNPVTPSAYVIYSGDLPVQNAQGQGSGRVQLVVQNWVIVIVVYLADSRGVGEGINNKAGVLMSKIIAALTNWIPDPQRCKPITRSSHFFPVQYDNGYGYFPIAFKTAFVSPQGGK